MSEKSIIFGSGVALMVLITSLFLPTALAHAPKDVGMGYMDQTLRVTIVHDVGDKDPATHYVKRVVVRVNGEEVLKQDYSSQPAKDRFTYDYNLSASEGDAVEAEAYCSIYGSKRGRITLDGSASSDEPSSNASTRAPGPGVILALGGVGAVYALGRSKRCS